MFSLVIGVSSPALCRQCDQTIHYTFELEDGYSGSDGGYVLVLSLVVTVALAAAREEVEVAVAVTVAAFVGLL